jgi:outer membrane protein assembly factor BamA
MAILGIFATGTPAQETTALQPNTRTELIEQLQKEKSARLQPAQPGRVEEFFNKYLGENPQNNLLGGIPGLRLRFGGLPTGAGFALGPEYYRPDLAKGRMLFRISAVGSDKLWYALSTELRFPHLAKRYLDLRLSGSYTDANSLDYYGPGPESEKSGHTNFRREEGAFDFGLWFKPTRRYLSLGVNAGYSLLNVGPGQSSVYASTDKQYSPIKAPGIDRQTNYLRIGPFLEFDSRDKPRDPHSGTHFLARFNIFKDRQYERFSFSRAEGSIEQYIPFFNEKRTIALRIRSVLSYPDSGNIVPFYMQPNLGGASDLRGYHRYRFYDNDLFLTNVEYRWEIFTLMDMALFADAGKVFHKDSDFTLKELESDVGFGIRFKTRRAVVFRIDTAFSHEGFGLWLNFDHVF